VFKVIAMLFERDAKKKVTTRRADESMSKRKAGRQP
jgi:hypothetical protein